jgi:hypothetical protein
VVALAQGTLPQGQVRHVRPRDRPVGKRHRDPAGHPLPPIAPTRAGLVALACTLTACGGGGTDRAPDPLRDLAVNCLATAPAATTATRSLPTGLLPDAHRFLTAQRAADTTYATAIVDATIPVTHDAILRRAPGLGWKVDRHDLEAKEAEVYLHRGATRLTVRLARAGRCAGVTSVLYAAVSGP